MIELRQTNLPIGILLCGGDKGSQAEDIKTAKRLAADWSNESRARS